jgi:hypothetical protein
MRTVPILFKDLENGFWILYALIMHCMSSTLNTTSNTRLILCVCCELDIFTYAEMSGARIQSESSPNRFPLKFPDQLNRYSCQLPFFRRFRLSTALAKLFALSIPLALLSC